MIRKTKGFSKSGSGGNYYLPIFSILFASLILLIYLKYKFNGMTLKDFSLFSFGNLLDVLFASLIAIGILITDKLKNYTNKKVILILLILSFGFYFFVFLCEIFHWQVPEFLSSLIISKRIYYMYLFSAGQFIQIYVFALIAGAFFTKSKSVFLKAFFKAIFIVVMLFIFCFAYSVLKKHDDTTFEKDKYETGVVLGAAVWHNNQPSPIFEGRIKKAYELYSNKIIKKIQVTGGGAPGEKTEAKAAYDYLMKMGINPDDIQIEEKSMHTVDQIAFLKKKYASSKIQAKYIIISDEFHLVRALEICRFFNLPAQSAASEYEITWEKLLYFRLRESAALLLFWLFAI